MNQITPFFTPDPRRKARVALFLSGQGSNARKLLESSGKDSPYEICLLVTDAPETSAARTLAETFHLPLAECDIRKFYADRGETDTRLDSPRKQEIRNEWSAELYRKILPYSPDFGILAGFVSMTNIVGRIPCLNVHPGDLTVEENGRRILAGLHLRPVENAILHGFPALRSSVILTQEYAGSGKKEMDGGPVLGISAPVPVMMQEFSLTELRRISDARQGPPGDDPLRLLAKSNVENLKIHGDHQVLPAVTAFFAQGRYAPADDGGFYFRENDGKWHHVSTVECLPDRTHTLRPYPEKTASKPGSRLFRSAKAFYMKMVRERGNPNYIARGWAVGVWVGCVIPVFCQLIVAIPLSFLFRGSKIGAAAGTFVTTPPTAVFIYPVQIWVGLRLIGSSMSIAEIRHAISGLLEHNDLHSFVNIGGEIIAAFFAGGLLWAAFMTPLTFFGVRFLVMRYRRFREKRLAEKRKNEGMTA